MGLSWAVLVVCEAVFGLSWAVLGLSEPLFGLTWDVLGRGLRVTAVSSALRLPLEPPQGLPPTMNVHHSRLALSVTCAGTGTERVLQQLARDVSWHRSLLGALALRDFSHHRSLLGAVA